jgi:hypothetical protein
MNLRKHDLLERKETLQLYCEQDQKWVPCELKIVVILTFLYRFLADRFAEGTCPYSSYPVSMIDTTRLIH